MDFEARRVEFERARAHWESCALAHADAKEAYRSAHARAFAALDKGTDTARKAAADFATGELRAQRDRAEIAERSAHHALIFWRGSAGEAEVMR